MGIRVTIPNAYRLYMAVAVETLLIEARKYRAGLTVIQEIFVIKVETRTQVFFI